MTHITARPDEPTTMTETDALLHGKQWTIRAEWREVRGRLEPTAVVVIAPDGEAVSAETMRLLPIGTFIAESRHERAKTLDYLGRILVASPATEALGRTTLAAAHNFAASHGERSPSFGELEEVATVYRQAHLVGLPARMAVAETFHLTSSGAAKRIAKARRAGLLGPARPGTSGEST